jgi:hypothetical protein
MATTFAGLLAMSKWSIVYMDRLLYESRRTYWESADTARTQNNKQES